MFYWIQTSPSASAIVQPNQTITTNSTDKHKTFNIYFYLFLFFIKHKFVQHRLKKKHTTAAATGVGKGYPIRTGT